MDSSICSICHEHIVAKTVDVIQCNNKPFILTYNSYTDNCNEERRRKTPDGIQMEVMNILDSMVTKVSKLQDIELQYPRKGCHQWFHRECLYKWREERFRKDLDFSCPMCRESHCFVYDSLGTIEYIIPDKSKLVFFEDVVLYAIKSGYLKDPNLLIQLKINYDYENSVALDLPLWVQCARSEGCSFLHAAIYANNYEMVKFFLDKKLIANIDTKTDFNGNPPLLYALNRPTSVMKDQAFDKQLNQQIVEILFYDPNVNIIHENYNGETALSIAAFNDNVEAIKLMLEDETILRHLPSLKTGLGFAGVQGNDKIYFLIYDALEKKINQVNSLYKKKKSNILIGANIISKMGYTVKSKAHRLSEDLYEYKIKLRCAVIESLGSVMYNGNVKIIQRLLTVPEFAVAVAKCAKICLASNNTRALALMVESGVSAISLYNPIATLELCVDGLVKSYYGKFHARKGKLFVHHQDNRMYFNDLKRKFYIDTYYNNENVAKKLFGSLNDEDDEFEVKIPATTVPEGMDLVVVKSEKLKQEFALNPFELALFYVYRALPIKIYPTKNDLLKILQRIMVFYNKGYISLDPKNKKIREYVLNHYILPLIYLYPDLVMVQLKEEKLFYMTFLVHQILDKNYELVDKLIRVNPDTALNGQVYGFYGKNGVQFRTLPMYCIGIGNYVVMDLIIKNWIDYVDPNVEISQTKETILHIGCKTKKGKILKKLIENRTLADKININHQDHNGRTALMVACDYNQLATFQWLCEHFADQINLDLRSHGQSLHEMIASKSNKKWGKVLSKLLQR